MEVTVQNYIKIFQNEQYIGTLGIVLLRLRTVMLTLIVSLYHYAFSRSFKGRNTLMTGIQMFPIVAILISYTFTRNGVCSTHLGSYCKHRSVCRFA